MLVLVFVNIIICLLVAYLCLRAFSFDFSIWTVGINFMICGAVLALSALGVRNDFDENSILTFLATIMLIIGAVLFIAALILHVPKKFDRNNFGNLGVILTFSGIIVMVILWHRPLIWTQAIIPEIAVIVGIVLLVKNRMKR
ncbi:hypothetical protein [uncultured Lactobacillus sp.]|uniref:hypothetical protein n=1 Tax=uncultured Lactobacillus sp. TaxID=153152 RepID=UPI0026359DF6|nr:hypothetical protein [uncultured Lactobacillus sp.]